MTTASYDQTIIEAPEIQVLHYTGEPMRLSMSELILLWDNGLLNDQAFCVLALKFDKIGVDQVEPLNLDEFADRWEAPENDRGKSKRLSHKAIQSALAKLEKVGNALVETTIQLKIHW